MTKKATPENCLATNYPDIAKEWDYEKNNGLTPYDVTWGNGKKVWWKCPVCGYSYLMSPNSRTNKSTKNGHGQSCPVCAGKIVICGYNDLKTLFPDLCHDWNYEKNKLLKKPLPEQYTPKSGVKVHWKCHIDGGEWESTIASRTSINKRTGKPSGCPYCAGKLPLIGVNDLKTLYPEIAEEWDFDANLNLSKNNPEEYTPGSNVKVWWKCKLCGTKWKTQIKHRTDGESCPKCKNQFKSSFQEQAIYYYLNKIFPDIENRNKERLGVELDIYLPSIDVGIEYDGYYFHRIRNNRIESENRKILLSRKKSLRLIHIVETDTVSLLTISEDTILFPIDSKRKYLDEIIRELFRLLNVSDYSFIIDSVADSSAIQRNYYHVVLKKSLGKQRPDLLRFWDWKMNGDLNPETLPCGTQNKVWWKCPICGKSYQATVSSKTRNAVGTIITCRECYYFERVKIKNLKSNKN